MANKVGRNKKVCEKYRTSGRRAINNDLKQKRHEKEVARFAKRREEGKTYTYSKQHSDAKLKELFSEKFLNSKEYRENKELFNSVVFAANKNSNRAKHMDTARWNSKMRKVQNEIDKKQAAMKAKEKNGKRTNIRA